MIVIVAYNKEDGSVWQHFGRTEYFKLYEISDDKIVSERVTDTQGKGHGALVDVLVDLGANVFICGGLGAHVAERIEAQGIRLIPGVEGDADAAVTAFISGELEANEEAIHEGCHHHEEEQHTLLEGPNSGKKVRVHYTGTFNDGAKFDSSYDRGEPLEFVCGAGMMIKGFDVAVLDMEVGQKKSIHLMPEEAYGEKNPDAILEFAIEDLPGSEGLNIGQQVYLSNQYGQPVPVTVVDKTQERIVLDANHEMAGKELNFEIELVEIAE